MAGRKALGPPPTSSADVDEDLQSRQLALYGHVAMRTLRGKTVLIVGLTGLAMEIAKNVVLANVRELRLLERNDSAAVSNGRTLFGSSCTSVAGCVQALRSMNPDVTICNLPRAPFSSEHLSGVHALVVVRFTIMEGLRSVQTSA